MHSTLRVLAQFASIIAMLSLAAFVQAADTAQPGPADKPHDMAKHAELGMSAIFDGEGALWTVAKETAEAGDFVVIRKSSDGGQTWSTPVRINSLPEVISASGENRPKLAFGAKGEFYASWTKTTSKNYTGDVRFSRSLDGGKTWSAAVNIHKDGQLITHAFESLLVSRSGRLYAVWIDKRDATATRAKGEKYDGAGLYYAVSDDGGMQWRGDFKIADHSCECCRIALTLAEDGAPLAFWRHVFPDGERDHALLKLSPDGKLETIRRATFDHWKIDACPHHGPALAVAGKTMHAVWFDVVDGEGKLFYGRLKNGSVDGQRALPDARAEHADIAADGNNVWIVWKSFDGEKTSIHLMASADSGVNWREQTLASTAGNSDHPHLAMQASRAMLVWNTEREGVVIKPLCTPNEDCREHLPAAQAK